RSWRSGRMKLPHFLVKGRGKQLEAILERLVAALYRERLPGVEVAFAGELANVKGVNRPLRVLSHMGHGHFGATDVVLRAEGSDLYVNLQSSPRTRITYLRIAIHAGIFVFAYAILMALYLFILGGFNGWVIEYSQKYAKQFHENNESAVGFM